MPQTLQVSKNFADAWQFSDNGATLRPKLHVRAISTGAPIMPAVSALTEGIAGGASRWCDSGHHLTHPFSLGDSVGH